jgi:hypothetical protein
MGYHETAEQIRKAPTARKAQQIADSIVTDSRWTEMKKDVMYMLLQEKARQCEEYRDDLMRSEDRILVEDTTHEYWGRGRQGHGLNMLGSLHMAIRSDPPKMQKNNSRRSPLERTPYYPRSERTWRPDYPTKEQQSACYNCGERGHSSNTCRLPSPFYCYTCGAQGHKRKHCRTAQ